ncbi:hypothetical protein D3C71_1926280 [compost metagenome]
MHGVGEWQQDRDGRQRSHTRQHADQVAHQHTEKGPHQVVALEGDAKAEPEVLQCLSHGLHPPLEERHLHLQCPPEDHHGNDHH